MNNSFFIPTPEKLPIRISPCPIVEAILEIRFVTSESWSTLPGLFFGKIRDRYPEQKELPQNQIPESLRRQDPAFTYLPLLQFRGTDFMIQFGPRVISLVTMPHKYPGWPALEKEMAWLLDRIQMSHFITEADRLGVRYIDFLDDDIFSKLILHVNVGEKKMPGNELTVSTVLRKKPFTARLQVSNSAIVGLGTEAKKGSILDLDVWLASLDFDLFKDGNKKFGEAHRFIKEIFFGLLSPEFLLSLKPEYHS